MRIRVVKSSSRGGKGKETAREVLPFSCRFFSLSLPLVLAAMSTPNTYESPEFPCYPRSDFE
jgi:hypothetical protein